MIVETILWIKLVPRDMLKLLKFLVRNIFKKKSGAKKPIFFHETGSTAHHSSTA